MYAVVVISLMFDAVIVMVKKAGKEVTTMRISGSSIRVRPNPGARTGSVTEGHFSHLRFIKRYHQSRPSGEEVAPTDKAKGVVT
jgi:hypothetical protein